MLCAAPIVCDPMRVEVICTCMHVLGVLPVFVQIMTSQVTHYVKDRVEGPIKCLKPASIGSHPTSLT